MNEKNDLIQIHGINALTNMELTREIVESEDFAKQYGDLAAIVATLDAALKTVKDKITKVSEAVYEEEGTSTLENGSYKFTYVAPTTAVTVDNDKLKKDFPDVYKQCLKTSSRKASLKVTAVAAPKIAEQ